MVEVRGFWVRCFVSAGLRVLDVGLLGLEVREYGVEGLGA